MKGRIILALGLLLLVSGGIAGSNEKNASQLSTQPVITVEALKGETVTDLSIHVPHSVTIAKKIQVKAYYANGTHKFTTNFFDMTALNGVILIQFDDLLRGERVDVRLRIEKEKDDDLKGEENRDEAKEGDALKASTVVLLRPDLAFYSVDVAGKVLVGDTLSVNATIQELNGDRGAEAVVSLMDSGNVLATGSVNLSAGGMASVILSTTFTPGNLSVKISNAVPAEYNDTNNVYPLVVSAISPDLTVTSVTAPAQVTVGESFEALATISELSGDVGADATVALFDNGTVLDSKMLYIPANGSGVVSFNISLDVAGEHDMVVNISSSVPSDSFTGNNERTFGVMVVKPLESMSFWSKYYYQNTFLNESHYIAADGHVDNSEEQLLKEDEVVSFTAVSNKTLSFPIDRIYLNITNEAGQGNVYVEAMANAADGSTFTKYYPDAGAVLTLHADENGTSVSIESRTNSSAAHSKGYLYWWYKGAQEWDVITNTGSGRLIQSTESLRVRVELEDGPWLLGGSAVTVIGNRSYVGGWTDYSEGLFVEQRSVWVYSGNGSGDTVS
jgi:hypothetical protein